jgi:hypothetical protein
VAPFQVKGAGDWNIAHVGDPADLVWVDPGDVMDSAYQTRHIADLARPVTLSGPVFYPAIERHTDQCDIQLARIADQRRAHKGRDPRVARRGHGRVVEIVFHMFDPPTTSVYHRTSIVSDL